MEAQPDSPYYSYAARYLTVIHTHKEKEFCPLESEPINVEQILNLPAHRTLYYRDRSKIKSQKIALRGPALVFCIPASSCHNWAMASGHIITQAPWVDSSDATYIAGCVCSPPEQKAGLHFPPWSVCRALCHISEANERATWRMMARISASLACVGGVSMGSFDWRGGGRWHRGTLSSSLEELGRLYLKCFWGLFLCTCCMGCCFITELILHLFLFLCSL